MEKNQTIRGINYFGYILGEKYHLKFICNEKMNLQSGFSGSSLSCTPIRR